MISGVFEELFLGAIFSLWKMLAVVRATMFTDVVQKTHCTHHGVLEVFDSDMFLLQPSCLKPRLGEPPAKEQVMKESLASAASEKRKLELDGGFHQLVSSIQLRTEIHVQSMNACIDKNQAKDRQKAVG